MKTLLLTLALLPLSVSAHDASFMIPIQQYLLSDIEPPKCYLWEDYIAPDGTKSGQWVAISCPEKRCYLDEDRLDQNGNWSSVRIEVNCPAEVM